MCIVSTRFTKFYQKKKTFCKTLIDFVGETNVKRIMPYTRTDTLMAQRLLFNENNGPGSACGGLWWCVQQQLSDDDLLVAVK